MRLFGPLYDRALLWSAHRHAPRYLAALSFAESSFFPVPPDVMLIPMAAARPGYWSRFALITTAASVLGGVAGYLIGYLALDLVEPLLLEAGYTHRFEQAQTWFNEWGVWVVFVAGFSPIPYKLFTLSAGALAMAFLPFLIASFVGRGARFFLVALLTAWLGPRMEPTIRRYIEGLGWATVGVLGVVLVWYQLRA